MVGYTVVNDGKCWLVIQAVVVITIPIAVMQSAVIMTITAITIML